MIRDSFFSQPSTLNPYSGQVMVLTVLALGGTLLGLTGIAGLLMVYQIRQATDLANSSKAIFAADAGIEWALYDFDCHVDEGVLCGDPDPPLCVVEPPGLPAVDSDGNPIRVFDTDGDGALGPLEPLYRVRDDQGNRFCIDENSTAVRSVGTAGRSSRAFELAL